MSQTPWSHLAAPFALALLSGAIPLGLTAQGAPEEDAAPSFLPPPAFGERPKPREDAEPAESAGLTRRRRSSVGVAWVYTPSGPATYDRLVYSAPDGGGRYDRAGGTGGASPLGFAVEARRGIGNRWLASLGLRYRKDQPFEGRALFDEREPAHEMVSKVQASAVGVWIDAMPGFTPVSRNLTLESGAGLDLDRSTVQLVDSFRDERAGVSPRGTKVTMSSNLVVASLRLVGGVRYALGAFELGGQVAALVPLFSGLSSVEIDAGDAGARAEALDHRAAVGAEVLTTLAWRL